MKKWEVELRPMFIANDPIRVVVGPIIAATQEDAQRTALSCMANGSVWAVAGVAEVVNV